MLAYAIDEDSGELALAISPHFAKAILGEANQYIQINLDEMRALKHPAATVLHMIISSRLNLGGKRKERETLIHIDNLAEAAYGPSTTKVQARGRRRQVVAALDELHKLDYWFINYHPKTHKVHIYRVLPDNKHLEEMMQHVDRIERDLAKED
jgi:trimethylamine:corrinoid methyltransferase-like protein